MPESIAQRQGAVRLKIFCVAPGHLSGMMESLLFNQSRASLFTHCRQLSSMSESIAQRMDVALDLQQKAN